MNPIARALAKRGYVVVNATYRGTPDFRYPAPVDDLLEAIRWMRKNAVRYGIDPYKIATFGFSAGGHLAALVALKDGNPENVSAIVAGSAPFDLSLYPGDSDVPAFLGGTLENIPERFRDASPVNHVTSSCPPIFIYQGTRDTVVPSEHALRMRAAYRQQGFDTDIHWLNGRGHAGALLFPSTAIHEAIDFLDRSMKR